jgi:hypothetical protein
MHARGVREVNSRETVAGGEGAERARRGPCVALPKLRRGEAGTANCTAVESVKAAAGVPPCRPRANTIERRRCISSLTSMDDVFGLASDIPVPRRSWNCAAESLVVRKSGSRPIPHDGRWDLFFGRCLQAAAVCRRPAADAKHPALRKLFLRMEESWLRLGEQYDASNKGAIVEASQARVWMHAKPQRIGARAPAGPSAWG